ncbi:hypothetical protein POKO110462_03545 [Pontibacter korlensis]
MQLVLVAMLPVLLYPQYKLFLKNRPFTSLGIFFVKHPIFPF